MTDATRPPTQREALGLGSRQRILSAATALMAERGYAGTSIAAVKKKSGLPSGSIYWHFENKEALLLSVIEEAAARWLEALPDPSSLAGSAEQRLQTLLQAAADALEERPEFLRVILLISLERRAVDSSSLATIRRARALARDRLASLLVEILAPLGRLEQQDRVARRFADFALMVADGAFIAHPLDPEATDIQSAFDLMRASLISFLQENQINLENA
ncbi:TetR/AcrR family transcriptional regulator [Myxococcota bacterium]|nr:TetR/AcrR family transcriptional regulator [Myxococcota bacterium]